MLDPDQEIFETWPVLAAVALAFLGVFVLVVGLDAIPVRLLDPLWQLGVANSITMTGGYLLNGLALLFLASALIPDSPGLMRGIRLARRWAAIASLGFLLLVPLQLFSLWRLDALTSTAAQRQQQGFERNLASLRRTVSSARTIQELQAGLQAQGAPPLSPADLQLPPEEIKQRVLATFTAAENDYRRRSEVSRSRGAIEPGLLRRTIRSIGLSFLFGIALAAGARLPGSRLSLLQQFRLAFGGLAQVGPTISAMLVAAVSALLEGWEQRDEQRRQARALAAMEALQAEIPVAAPEEGPVGSPPPRRRSHGFVDEDYIRQINDEGEPV